MRPAGVAARERIVEAIRTLTAERAYPPTVREIGAAVGLSSSSTVQEHLRRLERDGIIRPRGFGSAARSIVLVANGSCPTCGGTGL